MMQATAQIDLNGGVAAFEPSRVRGSRLTMQQMHGVNEKYVCMDCAHLVKFRHGVTVLL